MSSTGHSRTLRFTVTTALLAMPTMASCTKSHTNPGPQPPIVNEGPQTPPVDEPTTPDDGAEPEASATPLNVTPTGDQRPPGPEPKPTPAPTVMVNPGPAPKPTPPPKVMVNPGPATTPTTTKPRI